MTSQWLNLYTLSLRGACRASVPACRGRQECLPYNVVITLKIRAYFFLWSHIACLGDRFSGKHPRQGTQTFQSVRLAEFYSADCAVWGGLLSQRVKNPLGAQAGGPCSNDKLPKLLVSHGSLN
jgi:hypothetical protein